MMYTIRVSDGVDKVIAKWKKSNPNLFKKYKKIYKELLEHPKTGLGHPEALRGGGDITWSRHITAHDRIIYDIYEEVVEVYILEVEGQIDGKSLESAENRLKNVLSDFERQGYRMKNGGYVDKRISFYSILCAVISLLFACFMCYLWTDAAKDRDNYKQYYEYFQEQAREQKGNK